MGTVSSASRFQFIDCALTFIRISYELRVQLLVALCNINLSALICENSIVILHTSTVFTKV